MKATFTGDPSQPKGTEVIPDTLQHLGLTFEKGKATEIPPELEAKFAGNNHFTVSGKEAPKASEQTTERVAALTERISTVEDVDALKAELATETRASGKAALEARIAELEA